LKPKPLVNHNALILHTHDFVYYGYLEEPGGWEHIEKLIMHIKKLEKKSYSSRDIIKQLEVDGWVKTRVRGDHHQFKHATKKGTVTVQHPVKDLSFLVVKSIYKQANWK
jgi:predicted RNA binding protein YcfA (HicA-like mRNA interferase family)